MPVKKMHFTKDEKKLAAAWEQIDMLWRLVLALKARGEIDVLLLGAVLDAHDSPSAVRETWRRICAQWLPAQVIEHGGQEGYELVNQEVRRHTTFWNEVLDKICARGG